MKSTSQSYKALPTAKKNSATMETLPKGSDFVQRLAVLTRKLGYEFNDLSLPNLALTHRSFDSKKNYERLEFLGDALLGMIIGEALYHRYPNQNEGRLTRMRATLVRQESLVTIAQNLDLSNHLILGVGERKGGGRNRASILADAVESLIGAIYLDSQDIEVTRHCVLAWYGDLIDNVNDQKALKDAKSRLQEWLQSKQFDLPHYELVETRGNAPYQIFVVRCQVNINNCPDITESGESRRIAEQKAAELMINQLHKLPGAFKKR
ncbi:ribonuclease III [Psychrobacter sp. Cmf 22.2]|jgi:ribonuclease III|uniref:ribonuclease III n=1 Tax=Psychrobacter sp. Cmf 22.2 TaxID=1926478 RepID=UPI000946AA2E|nr:ribonuclease III [Psychrobacter sp. Cmf 22.2]OLF37078.1 ribonuclease III [Psychrobacter sp. Cmf 22.2]